MDADNDRVRGRVEVEADHITDLRVQLWVGGELEGLDPVGADNDVGPGQDLEPIELPSWSYR